MKLFCGLLLFGFIFSSSARAGNSAAARLTLADATREALAHNPGIQEVLSRWNAAKEQAVQEGAWDDLQVSGMSRLGRFVSVSRNAFADQTLSVSQMIPVTGKNLLRARAAAEEALMTYEEARRRELDVVAQTRTAYYRLANTRAQMELTRQNLALLQQLAEVTRGRYEAGNQGAGDVLAAEVEAGKLPESARDLDRERAEGESQLNVLMGRDAFQPVGDLAPAPAPTVDLNLDRLRALTIANRPEIRGAEHRLEAAKIRLELAHREWIPDPDVTLEGQRYNAAGQGVSEVDAGISFNIPWTNAPKYSAGVREAASNVVAAQHALDAARQEAMGLLRDALEDAAAAQHHEHLSGGALLAEANDAQKTAEIGYQSGKSGLTEWIMAARNLRDLQSMGRESLTDYQAAIAQVESIAGAPLTENFNQSQ
jgi:outer membrane protein TolC